MEEQVIEIWINVKVPSYILLQKIFLLQFYKKYYYLFYIGFGIGIGRYEK